MNGDEKIDGQKDTEKFISRISKNICCCFNSVITFDTGLYPILG